MPKYDFEFGASAVCRTFIIGPDSGVDVHSPVAALCQYHSYVARCFSAIGLHPYSFLMDKRQLHARSAANRFNVHLRTGRHDNASDSLL